MTQSINDGATVKIFYECRLAKIGLNEELIPKIEEELEIITEEQESSEKQKTKAKWAQLEAIVGAKERLKLVAKDILNHFEKRKTDFSGKAIIVGMSRRVCVDLYDEIVKLKPGLHSNDDTKGKIKIVMSGSASDIEKFQPHIRNKKAKEDLASRMRNPDDELEIVIVRDMWLTGFDAPCINTMYIDKPMKGHSLIQAISRVNRVFQDKTAGLIVDYIGIGNFLKSALMVYTNKDKENVGIPTEQAISLMLEKYHILQDILHGFNYTNYFKSITQDRLKIIGNGMEHILNQKDGKKRFIQHTTELLKSHSLCASSDDALKIANEIEYFKSIKAQLIKLDRNVNENTNPQNLDLKISEMMSRAIKSEEVVDIFAVAGIEKPNLSILSDDFLEEVKNMTQKNFALELLQKLLNDEIKIRLNKNKVQEKKFVEMLKLSILKYQNRTIETAKIIEELILIGKQIREYPDKKIKELGLTQDEIAFYDALGSKQEVKEVMSEDILKDIAKELVKAIRENKTVDWSIRDSARAKMRLEIKKLLKKYRYPPEEQEDALKLVMEQAERSCEYLEAFERINSK
jgi:type I restriction enzyme R subunit